MDNIQCFKRAESEMIAYLTRILAPLRWLAIFLILWMGGARESLADSDIHTVVPYPTGTRITADAPVVGGTRYGRLIRLQNNGTNNGVLIATFEAWPNDFRFYKSTDDGFTWAQISAPILSSTSGWVMKVEPDLYELPTAAGNLPAGTLLLAGNATTNGVNSHRMEVWSSTNMAVTWQFRGLVDSSVNQGLWEPRLNLTSSGQLVCYYSDERFSASGYNQLLGERVSPDGGLNWGPEMYVCAVPDGIKRPGMPVTTKLPNGQHVVSFEGVGFGGTSQIYIKFSSDGTNWGSGPTDLGTAVKTSSGAYLGACPYIMWSPVGGSNGTVIISGVVLKNSVNTDRQLLINTNLGQGNWTMLPSPVQWQGGGNNLAGWSQGMISTADGQGIVQMASSQITVGGNTNYNEMLVGRAQLIVPGKIYSLLNKNSGLALEIPGNSPTHGVGLAQGNVTGSAAQLWMFNDLGNNTWSVVNPGNRLAWDDTGWATNVGTMLEQWDYNGLAPQQFKLRPLGTGGWKFVNVNAALNVAVTNASASAGAAVVLWTNVTTTEQTWFPIQPKVIPDAYYPLNGDPLDATGHGNDGVPNATGTNYVIGRNGRQALQFNGTDSYVRIPRCIGSGSAFSIAFWMKTASLGGGGAALWYNGAGLVDGEISGTANDFGVSLLSGKIAFGIGNPDTTLLSTVTVNDNQWHHVAVTRDTYTGRMTIYLDGVVNTNWMGPVGVRMVSAPLRLGSLQNGAGGRFYNGALADVRLYNGWLDSNAVTQLFNEPSLLVQLKFDETGGVTAADATGHGWDGTLWNSPTWVAGQSSNAVSLNGTSQYVSLPTNVVNSLNDFTLATWVYWNVAATWAHILDFGSGTTAYMGLVPRSGSGTMRFNMTVSGNGNEQQINAPAALPAGGWHHVAVTLKAGIGVMYLDGVPVGTNSAMTLTPSQLGITTQNWLGRSEWVADPYFNGRLDDFRLYSGALSPAEIATLVTPLSAPGSLAGTRGDAQTFLNWSASLNANGYNLKRAQISGGPYSTIAANWATQSFTDSGLLNGTNYYYVVTATNAVGESGPSSELSLRPVSASSPILTWSYSNGAPQLNWPDTHVGWVLQVQTNTLAQGLGTNWITVPESAYGNQYLALTNSSIESAFYRLLSPY